MRDETTDGRTRIFDGDQLIIEVVYFTEEENWDFAEFHLCSGEVYRRESRHSDWECVAGTRQGERFDHIEYDFEKVNDEKAGALFGCADVNLVGLDAVFVDFPA